MAKEKIELTKCVQYQGAMHLPGVVLDVPEEDVLAFLDANVGRRVEQPAAPAPFLPSAPVETSFVSNPEVDTETGNVDGEEYDLVEDLQTLPGVTEAIAEALAAAGIESKEHVKEYSVEELTSVEGVTEAIANDMLNALKVPDTEPRTDGSAPETTPDKPTAPAPEKVPAKGNGKSKAKK